MSSFALKPNMPLPPLPDVLIYDPMVDVKFSTSVRTVTAVSTKGDFGYGKMIMRRINTHLIPGYNGKSVGVDLIFSKNSGKGYGRNLIEYAKTYSKQIGREGYMILKADSGMEPMRVPHIFYRKCGFTTLDDELDAKLDMFIKRKKTATHNDFKTSMMYYYPNSETKQKGAFAFFKNLVSGLKKISQKLVKTKI